MSNVVSLQNFFSGQKNNIQDGTAVAKHGFLLTGEVFLVSFLVFSFSFMQTAGQGCKGQFFSHCEYYVLKYVWKVLKC